MIQTDLAMPHKRSGVGRLARLRRSLLVGVLLALGALGALLLGAAVAELRVSIHAATSIDGPHLVRFHDLEEGAGGLYRWSLPRAAIFLYGFDSRPALLELTLAAPRTPGAPAPVATLTAPGQPPADLPLTPLWRTYHLLARTSPTGDTALQLAIDAYVPGGADTRELGVALRLVEARLPTSASALPPWRRALFLVALPLLLWLLLWRLGTPWWVAAGAGVIMLPVVGWAAATPAAAGLLLPTLLWPWLPALPLLLLTGWPTLVRGATGIGVRLAAFRPLLAGLALGLAGLTGLRLGLPTPAGLAVLAVGVGLVLSDARMKGIGDRGSGIGDGGWGTGTVLLLITAVALGLRLYRPDELPLGLWRDEARHGLLALQIWQDSSFRPIYVVEGADLPALLFYLMAPVVGIAGPSPWSVRLVSALAGGLMPLALWWAARPLVGNRAALFGAALLAWASWGLSMSRWAFPATLDHLLVLTAVGLVWRWERGEDPHPPAPSPVRFANRRGGAERIPMLLPHPPSPIPHPPSPIPHPPSPILRSLFMALAGICGGLAAYAYHSGRMAPLLLALLVLIRLGRSPAAWRRAGPGLVAAALAGLLTLAPLLLFIANDSEGYNRRVGSVMVFKAIETDMHAPLALLTRNVGRYLGMWHLAGDPNGRHHAPSAPMLDPLAGLLLVLGLALALRSRRDRALLALLAWFAFAHLPGLFSTEAPHAMRALGTLAPACMLAGLALDRLSAALQPAPGAHKSDKLLQIVAPTTIILALSFTFNTWLYFGQMARDPLVYGEFDVAATAMGRIARSAVTAPDPTLREVTVYLPRASLKDATVRFLTSGITVGTFDAERPAVPPGGSVLVLVPADAPAEERAAARMLAGPEAIRLADGPTYPDGRPVLEIYSSGITADQLR